LGEAVRLCLVDLYTKLLQYLEGYTIKCSVRQRVLNLALPDLSG